MAAKKTKDVTASYPLTALFDAKGRLTGFECWTVFGASPGRRNPLELDPGDRLYPTEDKATKARNKLAVGFHVAKHIVPVQGGRSVVRWSK